MVNGRKSVNLANKLKNPAGRLDRITLTEGIPIHEALRQIESVSVIPKDKYS